MKNTKEFVIHTYYFMLFNCDESAIDIKCKSIFEGNVNKLYAIIIEEYCTDFMAKNQQRS